MLEKREKILLEKAGSGCKVLLANDKSDDLSRTYRLFNRLPKGLEPMAEIIKDHITEMRNEIIKRPGAKIEGGEKDINQDPNFVKELLALHGKYMAVVNDQFVGNSLLQKALAFVGFVNRDVGKFKNADLMCSFCDRIMKTGGEKLGDVEEYLAKVVQLFSYLADKDLFAKIYRNQLARRLLNSRSASDDMERLMIGKLKLKCGSQFTFKMEGMMNDLAIGGDHEAAFSAYLKDGQETRKIDVAKIDFNVQVLTTDYWPAYKPMEVTPPSTMKEVHRGLQEVLRRDHVTFKRRLGWSHTLGNVTIRAKYQKSYDLQVTTLQACYLMVFSKETNTLVLGEVSQRLHLPDDTVKRILHSLSCGKCKVLKREGQGGRIKATDKFAFNASVNCPLRKFRIPMASLEESHNPKRVEEDRGIAIEAAIVRIMKARKTIGHPQLVAEVLSQLSFFSPNPKVIKARIHGLIEREYLERDASQVNHYNYLA
ncbi:conserved unknown protein [Ectocarpus siliculosus]|uniref:Cullin family profile domain-containing protein n=1 Tax=Ectocarpus siliculosus TaxID=2880 RepID=D7FJN2_ECTSI|nr:conserved unknown protein [Ectocarpus siliculosus]|eukprot:CBJ29134.1 conserved unknown protein [Ectocarpus siliculosus]